MKSIVGSILLLASMGVMADHEHAPTNGSNSGDYAAGAFNFTENSDQNVTSTISGGTVHGDSSANVAGNQYNCTVAGSCGDNPSDEAASYQNSYTGSYGGATEASGYGDFAEVEVLSYSYVETFAMDADGNQLLDTDTGLPISTGWNKVMDRNEDGSPMYITELVWEGFNSLDATLTASNNNLEAQRIASNSTQTVITTPSMGAPSINASNQDMCRAGVSGAVSTLGLGVSAGITLVDKNCERLKSARLLYNLGLMDVALALLGQDERIAAAMRQADPVRYAAYLDVRTEVDVEDNSANAETKANGGEVDHQDPQENQEKVDGGKGLLGTAFWF